MVKNRKRSISFILTSAPLIYICKVGLSSIFKEFVEVKYTTPKIIEEVVNKGKQIGAPDAFVVEEILKKKVINIKTPKNKDIINILSKIPELHEAEIEILALANEINGIVISDDSVARKVAEVFNIEFHGTAYLLLRLNYRGKISKNEVIKIIKKMITMGWRLSVEDYTKIIDQLK